jgi:hypothetical protein
MGNPPMPYKHALEPSGSGLERSQSDRQPSTVKIPARMPLTPDWMALDNVHEFAHLDSGQSGKLNDSNPQVWQPGCTTKGLQKSQKTNLVAVKSLSKKARQPTP